MIIPKKIILLCRNIIFLCSLDAYEFLSLLIQNNYLCFLRYHPLLILIFNFILDVIWIINIVNMKEKLKKQDTKPSAYALGA